MVLIIASHRRRLLQFLVVPLLPHLHEFFFQFPEQNIYWNIAPLRSARIFISNEYSFAQNWFRTRELCPFYPNAAFCSEFQNAQCPKFLPYLLVWVFKFIDLGCVGMVISWSFWISTFSSLYVSVHAQNLMKTAGLALELWRCWRIWFLLWSRIHGNALSCLQNNQVHTLPPGWRSGVETNANKPTIPRISTCGIASLAKSDECTCVQV